MDEVTISSKGQLVIPKHVRDALGWQEGTRLVIMLGSEKITVMKKPADPLASLVEQGGRVGLENIRRHIKTE